MLPIRKIPYLLPICCVRKMHKQSKNWPGVQYPLKYFFNQPSVKRKGVRRSCLSGMWVHYILHISASANIGGHLYSKVDMMLVGLHENK